MENPALLGKAFRAYCNKEIDSIQLQLFFRIIDKVFVPHLSELVLFLEDKHGVRTPSSVL